MNMKQILIRDDDISFFTHPEILDRLYGRLLDHSVPINLAVIPWLSCSGRLPFGRTDVGGRNAREHEPFIPPQFRGLSRNCAIQENKDLLTYIRGNSLIHVIEHGVTHDQKDLVFLSGGETAKFRKALREAKDYMGSLFGAVPSFFAPPWGKLTTRAVEVLRKEFLGVSLTFSLKPFLPVSQWAAYFLGRLRKQALFDSSGFLIVTHPFNFSRRIVPNPRDLIPRLVSELEKWDTLVFTNHHWEYLFDLSKWDMVRLNEWDHMISYLLDRSDIRFVSFMDLAKAHARASTH
jgi:hypothetical protein